MSNQRVTIVMYHYVRPLLRSRFPEIKGLEAELFRGQVRFIKRHYTPMSMDSLVDAMQSKSELPPRPCVLTFDDGYSDHYDYAFPIMMDEGVSGAFYPPRSVICDRKVLEVNKTHFILACAQNQDALEAELDNAVMEIDASYEPAKLAQLKAEYRKPNRFDTGQTIYIKRMLQHVLPDELRAAVADRLFSKYVTDDEQAFAEELYMSPEQARVMHGCGMHFGGHGDRHLWHSRLDRDGQSAEIQGASDVLDMIGVPAKNRTYCYPYGDNDDVTVNLLDEFGYSVAFLARPGIADLASESRFRLSRIDTNDLPKDQDAEPNEWMDKAQM